MVQSFTNEPGLFYQTEGRQTKRYGVAFAGARPYSEVRGHLVQTGRSHKQPTYQGDRKGDFPYHREIASLEVDEPFKFRFLTPDGGDEYYESYLSTEFPTMAMLPPAAIAGIESNARSASITKALNKLREGKTQLGVDIAEAKRTATMVASGVTDAYKIFRALKRGDLRYALRLMGLSKRADFLTLASPANAWLQYQYGWKPLLGSIHDNTALLIKQASGGFPNSIKAVASHRDKHDTGLGLEEDRVTNWYHEVRARTTLKASLTGEYLARLNDFGLINPLSVAWELVPFSFVNDWFMPVGNVLEALSASAGLTFAGGCTSSRTEGMFTSWKSPRPTSVSNGRMVLRTTEFDRSIHTHFPMPEFYTKGNPFSTPHIISAAALVRQQI